jgi:hypothetical protein
VNGSSTTPTKAYASTSYSVTPIKSERNSSGNLPPRINLLNRSASLHPLFRLLDRNYLGDSPQNISPKITPQESPPNIYSAGIHQVCPSLKSRPLSALTAVLCRRMSAEPLTSTRRSSNRRPTARSRFFRSRIPSRRSPVMHTLRPLTWPTSNQNPTTPRRSSCPRSCETAC